VASVFELLKQGKRFCYYLQVNCNLLQSCIPAKAFFQLLHFSFLHLAGLRLKGGDL
jgi:hypothetical protein